MHARDLHSAGHNPRWKRILEGVAQGVAVNVASDLILHGRKKRSLSERSDEVDGRSPLFQVPQPIYAAF